MDAFARLLRTRREALKLSCMGLSLDAGLDHTLIGRIERGERNATRATVAALATVLGDADALWCAAGYLPPDLDPATVARCLAQARQQGGR